MNLLSHSLVCKQPGGLGDRQRGRAIRQIVHGGDETQRRYLVIAQGRTDRPGPIAQVQLR